MNIRINGHTDDVGNESDNWDLSKRRAQVISEYIVSKGIAQSRIQSKGFGESVPKADNKTVEGRLINRRVEFEVIE